MLRTERFDAADYGFKWTEDWYQFDSAAAHKAARRARDARARELRRQGRTVRCYTHGRQQRTLGGVGSGHPEIRVVVSVYRLEVV